ncbi:type IV secretion system protein [Polynucleobacter sp. 86C-FISCH]|uniref:VirB8/TrbF family protein n=1 Tax=Polynucleobacter sp. 86C-FISCH TaxID=2689101 RepID=UPI001C0D795E|nr:VirB8/TrbF family protein [Polynucleobacter sp. 86C-FISCH]MBU3595066.1 type IV secretion system protein [Polynucleobacter sp. 86C-FISCH]
MTKKSSTQGAIANPYLNARREWDERYGDLLTRAHHWRVFALISAGITLAAVAGVIYMGSRSHIEPMVVTLDTLGSPIALAQPSTKSVEQRVLVAQVANWLWSARTVLPDAAAQKTLINRTYAMASNQVAQFLTTEYSANPPFGGKTVNVHITSVLPISKDTFEINWNEVTTIDGQPQAPIHWKANVTTGIDPALAKTPEVILANPLGIFLQTVSWTQILTPKS